MSYLRILKRLDEESHYQDTINLLAKFIEDVPQYNNDSWTTLADTYEDDRVNIKFILPSEEVRVIKVRYDFYNCGYVVNDGDERVAISHITGNPYLDMWTIYQEIVKMVSKC